MGIKRMTCPGCNVGFRRLGGYTVVRVGADPLLRRLFYEVHYVTIVKPNSPEQELEWARIELSRCHNDYAEAALALEAAKERVQKALLVRGMVCTECGHKSKLAMDAHLVICVRKSQERRSP